VVEACEHAAEAEKWASNEMRAWPNQPLQPSHSTVTRLAMASRAPVGGRLNGGVRLHEA
jgi:hypothetical protein